MLIFRMLNNSVLCSVLHFCLISFPKLPQLLNNLEYVLLWIPNVMDANSRKSH